MRITDLLKKQSIALSVSVKDKSEAIDTLVDLHTRSGNLNDAAVYKEGILAREQMGTTAIGMEVAIPHAKSEAVKAPALSAITVPNGVDYGAPDGQPCKLIFMIAATLDGDVHLEVLARLMQMLMHEDFTAKLKAAKTADEFMKIIDEQETAQFPEEAAAPAAPKKEGYRVLAVTACPTGIAHTYMAAESLAKAGEKMGITIKVETNGSGGAKNVLTAEEIANCDGIIIAADKNVETARFNGKPVYSTKVADGIHKPEELINKIVNGEAPVFHSDKKVEASAGGGNESFGRQLYKHLMNGVSHMLPFVVAGGIFIAIAFLIDTFAGNAGSADFGSVNQVAAWFKTIGGVAFNLMVPILAGFIAMSIADRPGLLVGLVGGFLATAGATFPLPGGDIPSGFLGGLLAGFVGGYMMLGIEKMCSKFPRALEGIKPVLVYPLLGLGGVAVLMCAINPIMGWINTGMTNVLKSMADSGLIIPLCALLAGMMAIDMGGPFNKAAYVFATGMLASQTEAAYMIMAAVMIGGMVPPIAIALSTTFFKSRWTDEERRNAPVNYIMGLSFITEGAIPYAAGHPLQVIPSCIVGSAAAGALSAIFQCKLMAPHGGVFVFATMQGTWMFYILALLIGAVLGMIMLAILKRPIDKK
ncbi:fructose-specific PTS transporter subunit EIIC [Ruminococcus sp. JL13D9]|uniref:PTS fructose transporter subunit IIABC n=1 Tax=Ruminococcus sp. JL13D9 TaxID=3233381 RepID=UPI003899F5F6